MLCKPTPEFSITFHESYPSTPARYNQNRFYVFKSIRFDTVAPKNEIFRASKIIYEKHAANC